VSVRLPHAGIVQKTYKMAKHGITQTVP